MARRLAIGNVFGSLIFLALSLGAFAIVWDMVEDELRFVAGARIVSGQVVDHVYLRSEQSGPKSARSPGGYYPVVAFQGEDGLEYRVQASTGRGSRADNQSESGWTSGRDEHPIGKTMRVAHRPNQPADARLLGFEQQYLYPLIIAVIGLMLLMFAVLIFREGLKPRASASTST